MLTLDVLLLLPMMNTGVCGISDWCEGVDEPRLVEDIAEAEE